MTCCPSSARPQGSPDPIRFAPAQRDLSDRVTLPGGSFRMGTDDKILPQDGEYPARKTRLRPFAIDSCAVTAARFARFIDDTGYTTDAESFGWSFVFHGLMDRPEDHEPLAGLEWWRKVDGACWRTPEGPATDLEGREEHPVTHVSWRDATAFASWAGGRLPTEAEWEFAALGGRETARYPWGDEDPQDTGFLPCNIWQGRFPDHNTGADGYRGTAPACSFAPNGYGLYNMVGNTWEWTADRFRIRSVAKAAKIRNAEAARTDARTVKGGSFICHRSYCYRYRIAARSSNTPDTTLSHTGFRLCYDVRT
ncbi:formylglycine-generating enzyme family protein [Sulfitobacter sp. HNIBRBA3233]|uniref:formylglycine-generating enzyme family protein n=1 Tax=Sulfitobacter marinivivus TaxID=3158558 RepID=UPI0032DE6FAF